MTHCLELLRILLKNTNGQIKEGETHYLADGIEGRITDTLDEVEYKITIKPITLADRK